MQVETPTRITHEYEQHIQASCEDIFPLYCPVRECDWVEGWMPTRVLSASGVAEDGCVFEMPGESSDSTWVITEHDDQNLRIAMLKIVPGELLTRLWIALRSNGNASVATIRYEYTALNEKGAEFVRNMNACAYAEFMLEWEGEMNRYLATTRGSA